ncbi:MAG: outer membrane beta-barrel protein [Gemmatimonadaceae bacterium]|nr:outer membrane beta-barrel protein [Gemmatimonadaceae bacterium]
MKRTLRALGLVAALAAPAALTAQAAEKTVGIGVSGGLSLPMGDLGEGAESGFNVTGHLYLKPAALKAFRLRGDVSYDKWNAKGVDGASVSALGFVANAVFDLGTSSTSSVKPYVLGGVGMFNSKYKFESSVVEVNESSTDVGIQAGAGINFQLSGFSTFAEARFVNVFGDNSSSNWIPITFGIRF